MSVDWVSFAFGAIAGPLALIFGFGAWIEFGEAIDRARERQRWATTCTRCLRPRSMHRDDWRCPKQTEYENDSSKEFTREAQP